VREREESVTDRERISEKEGCAWLAGLLTQSGRGRKRMEGAAVCLLRWREEQRRVQLGAWHGREGKNDAAGVLVEDKAVQKGARRRDEHGRAISSVSMLRGRGRAGQVREGFWRGIVRRVTGGVDEQ